MDLWPCTLNPGPEILTLAPCPLTLLGGSHEIHLICLIYSPAPCSLRKFRLFKRQLRRSGHIASTVQDPKNRLPEWALQRNVVLVELLFADVLLLMRGCRYEIKESEYILCYFNAALGGDNTATQIVFEDMRG